MVGLEEPWGRDHAGRHGRGFPKGRGKVDAKVIRNGGKWSLVNNSIVSLSNHRK